jgi:O-antigen ligase
VQHTIVVVPEWLSGMTRNHVGFARAGSNPADHVVLFFCFSPEKSDVFLFFLPFFKSLCDVLHVLCNVLILLCVTLSFGLGTDSVDVCWLPRKISPCHVPSWLGKAGKGTLIAIFPFFLLISPSSSSQVTRRVL